MIKQYWILDSFGKKVFGPFESHEEVQNNLPKTGNYRVSDSADFGIFKNATFEINLKSKTNKITNEQKEEIEKEAYNFLDKINKIAFK